MIVLLLCEADFLEPLSEFPLDDPGNELFLLAFLDSRLCEILFLGSISVLVNRFGGDCNGAHRGNMHGEIAGKSVNLFGVTPYNSIRNFFFLILLK